MEQIAIREYTQYPEAEILNLYRSVGWSVYYSHPEVLRQVFEHSLRVLAAYDGDQLVGLIRAVGDGQTVVFIQDLLVAPVYQRRGIGRDLVARLLERFQNVRQVYLITDDTPETVGFYKAVGLTPVEEVHCRAFTRLRY